jgi:hypothetical protein
MTRLTTLYLLHVPTLSQFSGGLMRTFFLTLSHSIIKGHCHQIPTHGQSNHAQKCGDIILTKLERDNDVIGPRDARPMLRLADSSGVFRRVQL